jgi:hypothetical protein
MNNDLHAKQKTERKNMKKWQGLSAEVLAKTDFAYAKSENG